MNWPSLVFVAETYDGKVVGYVIGKMHVATIPAAGHISSIAVMRSYRKCGIATLLLRYAHDGMARRHYARSCSLHVRCDNLAAQKLYAKALGYRVQQRKYSYYGWCNDAFLMKCHIGPHPTETVCCSCS